MRSLILFILSCLPCTAQLPLWGYHPTGLGGNVESVEINASGWWADVTLKSIPTNGTFATTAGMGFATNNTPVLPLMAFSVRSMSFDEAGNATTTNRIVYGTKQLRYAYPNNAFQVTDLISGNVKVAIALSDYIYAKDSNITYRSFPLMYLTNSITNRLAYGGPIVNNSTNAYTSTNHVANWVFPPYDIVTNSTLTARFVAFNRHGIRSVKFTATDASANSISAWATNMTIDPYLVNAGNLTTAVYRADINISSLNAAATNTLNALVYPAIGDAPMDTSLGPVQPTPFVGPWPYLNDRSGTYGRTCARVSALGVDSTGVPADISTFNQGTALAFATIGAAINSIRNYNNINHSRNNAGAGIVFVDDGTFVNNGTNQPTHSASETYVTVTRSSNSSARSAVIISGVSGTGSGANIRMQRMLDITMSTATANTFNLYPQLWFDYCTLNSATDGAINFDDGPGCWYVTRCTILSLNPGLRPHSTDAYPCAKWTCNDLTGFIRGGLPYLAVGNFKTNTTASNQTLFDSGITGSKAPYPVGQVIYNNAIYGFNCSTTPLWTTGADGTNVVGIAYVQNIGENYDANSGPMVQLMADTGTVGYQINVIKWNNLTVGNRENGPYNSVSANNPVATLWSQINNVICEYNVKDDTFPTANAARTNNWSEVWGVDYHNNILGDDGNGFDNAFPGVGSYKLSWNNTDQFHEFMGFVNNGAYVGSGGDNTGNGDYHAASSASPFVNMSTLPTVPFDISGKPRTIPGAAGPFEYP